MSKSVHKPCWHGRTQDLSRGGGYILFIPGVAKDPWESVKYLEIIDLCTDLKGEGGVRSKGMGGEWGGEGLDGKGKV